MAETQEAQKTQDHNIIKNWIQERDGKPAVVESTFESDKNDGLLRVDFPSNDNSELQEISWEKFFEIFDENNIQFLYQEKTESGEKSNFCKFISAN